MKRLAVFAILIALSGPAVQAGMLSDAYVFPVVVRSPGAAGSFWATELCINNPRPDSLTVVVGLFQNGGVADLTILVNLSVIPTALEAATGGGSEPSHD